MGGTKRSKKAAHFARLVNPFSEIFFVFRLFFAGWKLLQKLSAAYSLRGMRWR